MSKLSSPTQPFGVSADIIPDAFRLADEIASKHVVKGWFETPTSVLVRKIKLRGDIFAALRAPTQRGET